MKLYELAEARDILDGFLAETEGEETPEVKDVFDSWEADVQTKIKDTGLYLLELLAEADVIDSEINRLVARRNAVRNRHDWLKAYLQGQMERIGIDKVKTPAITVALQNSGATLVVDESVWTPERVAVLRQEWPELVRVQPEKVELNKPAILKLVKAHPTDSPLHLAGFSLRVPRWLALR